MKKNFPKRSWLKVKGQISKTIRKIRLSNNLYAVQISREEILIRQLELKLGKSREEVEQSVSTGLLSILSMVPVSIPVKNESTIK